MKDYRIYRLNAGEKSWAIALGCAFSFAAAWMLYRHAFAGLLASPLGFLYPRYYAKSLGGKRKDKLRLQFKEALHALSSLLSAGRSVENAMLSLEKELLLLLGDSRSDLLAELRTISIRLQNGEPIEVALHDFAARSGLEEARSFAEVFVIGKRAGGDLVEVVRRTSQLIGEKMDVEIEVSVLVAQKKFEAKIMMVMPFAFVGFLGLMAPDYMEPLHKGMGLLLLTACLALLLVCGRWIVGLMAIKL
ncbi:type II secretion system F family protein [Cohnella suwonensis]|uniref:Type II secretion system F family protein n=1 Tax=Cohnella suwonensis TaxID=696072 RepID=A0ABW0LZL2_9BACL